MDQMQISRRAAAIGGLSLLGTAATALAASPGEGLFGIGEGLEDFWLATDAYIYGYPLVTMEMTRRVMTNVAAPKATARPMGQFVRGADLSRTPRSATSPRRMPTRSTRPPGSTSRKEPWVLSMPDMKGRYFLFPMLDGWTNVFQVPGTRTTGTGAQTYAITGPGWTGKLPAGREGVQVAHRHGLDPRPHLLHRHARGLRGRATRCRTSASSCRLAPTASRTRRRPARSIRPST